MKLIFLDKNFLISQDGRNLLWTAESNKLGTHSCGSVIVNENWILTSAHCVQIHPTKRLLAYGHDQDLVSMFNAGRLPIESIHRHDHFIDNKTGLFNDIAMVKLATPLPLDGKNVAPACLGFEPVQPNIIYTMFGWGSPFSSHRINNYWFHQQNSRYLRELKLFKVNRDELCADREDILCAVTYGNDRKNHAACSGDGGSPVHRNRNGKELSHCRNGREINEIKAKLN